MLRTFSSQVVGALLGLALTAGPVFAQITTGTLAGTVRDASGATMPGVVVTATSESRNTLVATVTTNTDGDYVIPNVAADTYTVELKISGFKPVKRSGVSVSGGGRVVIPSITLEVGGASETVNVVASAPTIQAQSGERSFTVTVAELENLPISGRNFASFASLVPGVSGTARIGGGGQNNVMMDGVSAVDTGGNQQLLQLNPDAIAEVRVLTSGYQAEFGRGSGLQITAVTKSGTNRFRGSGYEIAERSGWNSVSWANQKNGVTPGVSKTDTFGYTLGGPFGRPGGSHKLFFFYSHEYRPSTSGGTTQRLRLPTNAELNGDFTQSTDNNGNLITLKAPYASGIVPTNANCGSVTAPMPCVNILAWWKNTVGAQPNISQSRVIAEKLNYNYETISPVVKNLLQQPAIRLDYQFSQNLRFSGKYAGQRQTVQVTQGTALPGFNDTFQKYPFVHTLSTTVNYTFNPTTFLEGTWGMGSNYLGAPPVSPYTDRRNPASGFANFPFLFNQDGIPISPGYNRDVLVGVKAPFYDAATSRMFLPPIFAFGSLVSNAPPILQFPEFVTESRTDDISISLTKVAGKHTLKAGFYRMHGYKPQNRGGPSATGGTTGDQMAFQGRVNFQQDASNPLDTGFGYSNALLGIFSTYNQQSKFVEGIFVYNNVEAYLQDNWKVNRRLTLDYGLRFVHMQPQYDEGQQSSNFFLDKWSPSAAPLLYVPGCAVATSPCPSAQRQAKRPDTGALLGANTAFAIGTVVPNSGDLGNGILKAGQGGNSKYNYVWPTLVYAPRTGVAYDVTGNQHVVLRGGYGLFFDRPNGNTVLNQIGNPPFVRSPVLRWSTLGNVAAATGGGVTTEGTGLLTIFEFHNPIQRSHQWNAGVQMALPWSSSIDVSYVGQHFSHGLQNIDINSIDFGAAFLPANQDTTLAAATNGSAAVASDLMRPYRGLGTIQQNTGIAWNDIHSIQTSFTRRFQRGFSFGLNYTGIISNTQNAAPRLEHYVDSAGILSWRMRADQATEQDLLGNVAIAKHQVRGNFVLDPPDYKSNGAIGRVIGYVVNDWQLSGIVTASSGTPYSVGFSYNSGGSAINLTGSPNWDARTILVQPNNLGKGCSSNQYAQFNNSVAAVTGGLVSPVFRAPSGPAVVPANVSVTGSSYSDGPATGLESGQNYLTGCPSTITDLALARTFRIGGGRSLQVRLDAFNAFNTVVFNARNTTLALNSPTNPTLRAAQFNADGTVDSARLTPAQAGFGAVTGAAALRTVQLQFRLKF